jgi:hypothetical protein
MKKLKSEIKKCCTCCGKEILAVPLHARFLEDEEDFTGYYWECGCQTTLFVPLRMLEQDIMGVFV